MATQLSGELCLPHTTTRARGWSEDGPAGGPLSHPRLTVSSSPHYLMFEAEGVVRGDTRLKCAPPLRGSRNRQQGTADARAGRKTLG